MEEKRSTRRNHIGQFTTTVILADRPGRIYGHGMTVEAANESADRKLASFATVYPAATSDCPCALHTHS